MWVIYLSCLKKKCILARVFRRSCICLCEFARRCRGDNEQPPIWQGAPAVKNGHVYMYGEFDDEFVMEDPYSLDLQLDKIVNVLLEKKQ